MSQTKTLLTISGFGIAVILSGLYRYFMEPNGSAGLWFGLAMGAMALIGALLLKMKHRVPGAILTLLATLFVGGYFTFSCISKGKHEIRVYLMILFSIATLIVFVASWIGQKKTTDEG